MDTGNCLVVLQREAASDLSIETKVVNGILIVAGLLSATAAGWWVGHHGPLIRH